MPLPDPAFLMALPGPVKPLVGDPFESTLGTARSQWRRRLAEPIAFTVLWTVLLGSLVLVGISERNDALSVWCLAILVVMLAVTWFFLSGELITIYTDGIERRTRTGVTRIPWAEVQSYRAVIYASETVGVAAAAGLGGVLLAIAAKAIIRKVSGQPAAAPTPTRLLLVGSGGKTVKLTDNIERFADLSSALLSFLGERLAAAALKDFETGQRVGFGDRLAIQKDVGITCTGVLGGTDVLPFKEVASVTVDGGSLVIRKKGRTLAWQRLRVRAVPNAYVFESVIASVKVGQVFA
jgi:hypothetical protein